MAEISIECSSVEGSLLRVEIRSSDIQNSVSISSKLSARVSKLDVYVLGGDYFTA